MTGARLASGTAIESLEEARELLGGNAVARVANGDLDGIAIGADLDNDLALVVGELQCIGNQVLDGTAQLLPIGGATRLASVDLESNTSLARERLEAGCHFCDHRMDVERLGLQLHAASLKTSGMKQLVHGLRETGGMVANDLDVFALIRRKRSRRERERLDLKPQQLIRRITC